MLSILHSEDRSRNNYTVLKVNGIVSMVLLRVTNRLKLQLHITLYVLKISFLKSPLVQNHVYEDVHAVRVYSGTPLIRTPLGEKKVSLLVRCPDFRGCNVHKQGVWDSQRCPVYRGVLISGVS